MTQQLCFESMAAAPITRSTRLQHARIAADRGIERVAGNAEDLSPGWSDAALAALRTFSRNQSAAAWTMEMARSVIEGDLAEPSDKRAWGSITRIAVKRGYIVRVRGGFMPAASSNGSPKPCYVRGEGA
ncbi:MAG: hypothetical protein H7255_16850 [Ramlibacter sp.]|nr:hypothetical protein [Ramlibacter sp.]